MVQDVNSYADIQASSYSKIDLDFVLNTSSYTTVASNDNEMKELNVIQCFPCNNHDKEVVVDTEMSSLVKSNKLSKLAMLLHNNSQNSSSEHHNKKTDMKTHYLKLTGQFKLKPLEALLDSLLYNNITSSGNIHFAKQGELNNVNKNNESTNYSCLMVDKTIVENQQIQASTIAATSSMQIYRMKGIIHVADSDRIFILQAVHNIFEVQPSNYIVGSNEDVSDGCNLLVLIGKNLDYNFIENMFHQCILNSW